MHKDVNVDSDTLMLGAVGDIAAFHDAPETMFDHVDSALREADILFAQNERHYNTSRATPVGGFTEQVPPEHAQYLKRGGFDVLSFASNHCMDLGEEPMLETIGVLQGHGFSVIGAGRNIEEARKPAIIERRGTKIAFLAYCSVLRPNYEANISKAGSAPMRAYTLYHQADYQPGTAPRIMTFADKPDLAAMVDDVARARATADIVAVSFHWGIHFAHAVIADYQREVAHAAIDAGADVILGHHPHMLKGIESYHGKPVFYSMGNFAFDLPRDVVGEWFRSAPQKEQAFRAQGWALDDPDWSRYVFPPATRKSMIVRCTISGKKLTRVAFLPVMINRQAQPQVLTRTDEDFGEVVDYMKEISVHQGLPTAFHVEGDEVVISAG